MEFETVVHQLLKVAGAVSAGCLGVSPLLCLLSACHRLH